MPDIHIERDQEAEVFRVHGLTMTPGVLILPESKAAPNATPNPREPVDVPMSVFNAAESDPQKSNRNVVVIGSRGRTGRLVVGEGLRRGHSMTAFTRRPDGLVGVRGVRAVVQGDGRNLDVIRRAIAGASYPTDPHRAGFDLQWHGRPALTADTKSRVRPQAQHSSISRRTRSMSEKSYQRATRRHPPTHRQQPANEQQCRSVPRRFR